MISPIECMELYAQEFDEFYESWGLNKHWDGANTVCDIWHHQQYKIHNIKDQLTTANKRIEVLEEALKNLMYLDNDTPLVQSCLSEALAKSEELKNG